MAKNYEEVAMDVIRENWEFRKSQHNASFNQERIARMMGISRSQFAKLCKQVYQITNKAGCFKCSKLWKTRVSRSVEEHLQSTVIFFKLLFKKAFLKRKPSSEYQKRFTRLERLILDL